LGIGVRGEREWRETTCYEPFERQREKDVEVLLAVLLVVPILRTAFGVWGSEFGCCITQIKAQGPSRTCNESKEEEEVLEIVECRSFALRLGQQVTSLRQQVTSTAFGTTGYEHCRVVLMVQCLRFRVYGLGFRVQASGIRTWPCWFRD